jgi:hypothetical protein
MIGALVPVMTSSIVGAGIHESSFRSPLTYASINRLGLTVVAAMALLGAVNFDSN